MYQFKNWKLICEEKDREITRLKEELERVKKLGRLTKRELVNEKHVGWNIEIGQMNSCPDCNDSCMYGRCKWQEKVNRKLKEYEDLEEQGKLLKLPCKVGDVLWNIENGEIESFVVEEFRICTYKIDRIEIYFEIAYLSYKTTYCALQKNVGVIVSL